MIASKLPMRSARDVIAEVVKTGIAPMLKQLGFKKSTFNFGRRQGSVAHFLNVQMSSWNQGVVGGFYINVGVMFDEMHRLRGAEPPELPKHLDCDFMVRWERLDSQLPSFVEVNENTDPQVLSEWLMRQIKDVFVKPLDAVSSTRDFGQTGWVTAVPWGFPAKFHYVVGDIAEARRLVQLEANTFADRGCTFESVAASLNLPLQRG